MSKTKSSDNPRYEALYIISNKFSENEVKPIAEKVNRLVTDNEGKISHEENWGKKRLAYPIKSYGYGYYNLLEFELPGGNLAKVERSLKLMSEVLRHQIVRKEREWSKPVREFKEDKAKIKVPKEEKSERPMTKTDLADLDEKLDKILDTNDLL